MKSFNCREILKCFYKNFDIFFSVQQFFGLKNTIPAEIPGASLIKQIDCNSILYFRKDKQFGNLVQLIL